MNINREKWIIDTDPGCDDMVCLLYLLARKNIDILMISLCEGNTTLENVVLNMRKIIKISGRKDIDIYAGSGPILKGCPIAKLIHMVDGLGDIDEIININVDDYNIKSENSSLKMIEYINKYPNEVNILMIGPLTNLAVAYLIEPEIGGLIKSIYIMGGSIHSSGNLLPCSEFNFSYDYIAPKIVLGQFKNIILVPWDTTSSNPLKLSNFVDCKFYFEEKKINYNELTYFYVEKMIDKICGIRGNVILNDFYCALCIFNKNVIENVIEAKCDISLDSEIMRGTLNIKHYKNIENNFTFENGKIIIITKLKNNVILEELKNIFI
jgi:inosine-uridine nucleoside N-ribohydrolase